MATLVIMKYYILSFNSFYHRQQLLQKKATDMSLNKHINKCESTFLSNNRNSIALIEVLQDSPACPSDKD
jgi:hypothetical protein